MRFLVCAAIAAFVLSACGDTGDDLRLGAGGGDTGPMATGGSGGTGGTGGNEVCTVACDNDTVDGTRLKAKWITGGDGSRMRDGDAWVDTLNGNEVCHYQKLPNGEVRCVPEHVVSIAFRDPNCLSPVHKHADVCDPVIAYVRRDTFSYAPNACPILTKSQLFQVGSEITELAGKSHYFLDEDGVCTPLGATPDTRYYNLVPAYDWSFYQDVPNPK